MKKVNQLLGLFAFSLMGILFLMLAGCSSKKQQTTGAPAPEMAMMEEGPSAAQSRMPQTKLMLHRMMGESPAGGIIPDPSQPIDINTEDYRNYGENPRTSPLVDPFSTFSVDVDTASYSNTRRFLFKQGRMPDPDSIRIEEFLNYFDYNYPIPTEKPFSIFHEMAPSPLDPERYLLRVGIQGKKVKPEDRPPVNLVFLLDVSGSMNSEDKLGLLKSSMILLSKQMSKKDRVSIAVYAGAAGVILDSARGDQTKQLKKALKKLSAGGSTAGGEGILLAYKLAEKNFIKKGINRIILATDGDFNVGVSRHEELVSMIEQKRENGVSLTILGFGSGNYNDKTMEQLADKGNGNYFYIDTLNEARKVLVDELSATLETIAKDVKIQVEFNPAIVKSYRLIGYENRKLTKEQFDDDTVDAGEIGAGHDVTALYEITLTGTDPNGGGRYQANTDEIEKKIADADAKFKDEVAFFRLRYKAPDGDESQLIEKALKQSEIMGTTGSEDFIFSAAVAYFAQLLRKSDYAGHYTYSDLISLLKENIKNDPDGYRAEMLQMVKLADSLQDESEWIEDDAEDEAIPELMYR